MKDYIISCCSACDISKEDLASQGIECLEFDYYIDGSSYKDYDDSYPLNKFYEDMKNGMMPTTSQMSPGKYTEYFESFLKQGKDVLHIAFSSGGSGTYASACLAANSLNEEYPNKVYVVDSLGFSSGIGLLTYMANQKKKEGLSIEENYEYSCKMAPYVNYWFYSTDLTNFIRGGRISKTAGLIGSALQICPLMYVSIEGKLEPVEKIRTKTKACKMALEKMINLAENGLDYDGLCFISHSNCIEDAELLANMIKDNFKKIKEVKINNIGHVVGCHTGQGTVALYFVSKNNERLKG